MQKSEDEVRARAKVLGIRNWHNRKIEALREEVTRKEEELLEGGGVSIPLDAAMLAVGKEGGEKLMAYVDALETLQEVEELVVWLDGGTVSWIVSGIHLDVIWGRWQKHCEAQALSLAPYKSPKLFSSFVSAWAVVHGWRVDAQHLVGSGSPPLPVSWHMKMWRDVSGAVDRDRAKSLFGVLLSA